MADTAKSPAGFYRLKRKFWNGKVELPVGHIEPFKEGKAPKSAAYLPDHKPEVVKKETTKADKKAD